MNVAGAQRAQIAASAANIAAQKQVAQGAQEAAKAVGVYSIATSKLNGVLRLLFGRAATAAAILVTPWVGIPVAVAAATTAVVYFSRKIKLSEDGLVTLGGVSEIVWERMKKQIGEATVAVGGWIDKVNDKGVAAVRAFGDEIKNTLLLAAALAGIKLPNFEDLIPEDIAEQARRRARIESNVRGIRSREAKGGEPVLNEFFQGATLSEDMDKLLLEFTPKLDALRIKIENAKQKFNDILANPNFGPDSEERKRAIVGLAEATRQWNEALVEAKENMKIEPIVVLSKWDDTLKEWDLETRTALENNVAQWKDFSAKVRVLVAEGLDKGIADARLKEKLDELIPEVEVTVKRIDTKPFKELTGAALRAAEQIQDAFANAVRSAFRFDNPRDIFKNLLDAIAEIPIQIAAQKIGEKIRKAMEPSLEKIFDPGKAARMLENEKLLGGTEKQTATAKAAEIVAEIKRNAAASNVPVIEAVNRQTEVTTEATVNAANSLCECICSCLGGLRDVTMAGPDKIVSAVDASARNVVAGVDVSVRNSTGAIVGAIGSIRVGGGSGGINYGGLLGSGLNTLAKGTAAGGGMKSGIVRVGEEGPETVMLPRGSRVMNQRQMAFAGGSANVSVAATYDITINGASDAKETRRQLEELLSQSSAKTERRIYNTMRENGLGRMRQ
jgi:hypothetical protein